MTQPDAVVIGSGPNGLAAAVTLARAGLKVHVYERQAHAGGGLATRELLRTGYRHDVCSAVHPLALLSEFFQAFGLEQRVELVTPEVSYAHALDEVGGAAVAYRSLEKTVEVLNSTGPRRPGDRFGRMLAPLVSHVDELQALLGPAQAGRAGARGRALSVLRRMARPLLAAAHSVGSGFGGESAAGALLGGVMAHSNQPPRGFGAAAAGLVLATAAHAGGWPLPVGGSQAIADALLDDLTSHGGEVFGDSEVEALSQLPSCSLVLADVGVRGFARLAEAELPAGYRAKLLRAKTGNAVAKVDFILNAPVPWRAQVLAQVPTVHLGGSAAQLAAAAAEVAAGRHAEHPFVLVVQPGVVDRGRAPAAGGHVLWAYAQVPSRSTLDATETVTAQVERFAPGFRDTIVASVARSASQLEADNPNYVGGDIGSGAVDARGLVLRPRLLRNPWRTPLEGVYLCSAATAPGPGVHGMAGWLAACTALRDELGLPAPSLAP